MLRRAIASLLIGGASAFALFFLASVAALNVQTPFITSLIWSMAYVLVVARTRIETLGSLFIAWFILLALAAAIGFWLHRALRSARGLPQRRVSHAVWLGPLLASAWMVGSFHLRETFDCKEGGWSHDDALALARLGLHGEDRGRTFQLTEARVEPGGGWTFSFVAQDCAVTYYVDECRAVERSGGYCP